MVGLDVGNGYEGAAVVGTVGAPVGALVGLDVVADGDLLGLELGEIDGLADGAIVGVAVGSSVDVQSLHCHVSGNVPPLLSSLSTMKKARCVVVSSFVHNRYLS